MVGGAVLVPLCQFNRTLGGGVGPVGGTNLVTLGLVVLKKKRKTVWVEWPCTATFAMTPGLPSVETGMTRNPLTVARSSRSLPERSLTRSPLPKPHPYSPTEPPVFSLRQHWLTLIGSRLTKSRKHLLKDIMLADGVG